MNFLKATFLSQAASLLYTIWSFITVRHLLWLCIILPWLLLSACYPPHTLTHTHSILLHILRLSTGCSLSDFQQIFQDFIDSQQASTRPAHFSNVLIPLKDRVCSDISYTWHESIYSIDDWAFATGAKWLDRPARGPEDKNIFKIGPHIFPHVLKTIYAHLFPLYYLFFYLNVSSSVWIDIRATHSMNNMEQSVLRGDCKLVSIIRPLTLHVTYWYTVYWTNSLAFIKYAGAEKDDR